MKNMWNRLISVTPLKWRKIGISLQMAGAAGLGYAIFANSRIGEFCGLCVIVGAFLTNFFSEKDK